MIIPKNVRGRGAFLNTQNPHYKNESIDIWDGTYFNKDFFGNDNSTRFTEVYPKNILNKFSSSGIPGMWSMNPYQGCEHGCTYCYARITHEYWGYNAGTDFEKNILVKKNAPDLLRKKLNSRTWTGETIMLSGNTDCYQPAEKEYKITQQLLQICLEYNQPVSIFTKNALICRDLGILTQLAAKNLVHVYISITTLNEELRVAMEPKTSSVANRLKTIQKLSQFGVPTHVMLAPIIPGLNSDEIFDLCQAVSEAGALSLSHSMVRLNGAIALLFEDWIRATFPLKATRVMHLIAEAQGGTLDNITFGERIAGVSVLAESINQQVRLATRKYNLTAIPNLLKVSTHRGNIATQLHLF